ncbi:DNA gyrase inhibitor YacG [bacterium]|nr:DNA gyrase inhibitor YacG [bacterium]
MPTYDRGGPATNARPLREGDLPVATCPRCKKEVKYDGEKLPRCFPFCSTQCQNGDLYHWLEESYSVPVETNRVVQEALEDPMAKGVKPFGDEPESLN